MTPFDESAAVEAMARAIARRNFKSWWPSVEVIESADATNKADGDILRHKLTKNESDLKKKTAALIPDMQAALSALRPFLGDGWRDAASFSERDTDLMLGFFPPNRYGLVYQEPGTWKWIKEDGTDAIEAGLSKVRFITPPDSGKEA